MKRLILIGLISVMLTACGPSTEELAFQTQGAATAVSASWTETPTFTSTATETTTPTVTPTSTVTPTITPTPLPEPVDDGFVYNKYAKDTLDWIVAIADEVGIQALYYPTYSSELIKGAPVTIGYSADGNPGYLYIEFDIPDETPTVAFPVFDRDPFFNARGLGDVDFLPHYHLGEYVFMPSAMELENLVGETVEEKTLDFNCRFYLTGVMDTSFHMYTLLEFPRTVYDEMMLEKGAFTLSLNSVSPTCDQ